jgi:formate dehydrogenase iron-sulfur subunit
LGASYGRGAATLPQWDLANADCILVMGSNMAENHPIAFRFALPACPFGVVDVSLEDGKAHKCTLCYDRLKGGLEPACAKSCPTDSIQFGELGELHARAQGRVEALHAKGAKNAYLYGAPGAPGATGGLQQLNAFFLLTAVPETYNLPRSPSRPAERVGPSLTSGLATVAGLALVSLMLFAAGRGERK